MSLVALSNSELSPRVNWTTLGPPVMKGLRRWGDAAVLAPPSPTTRAGLGAWVRAARRASYADTVFWMQLSSRPEVPLWALSAVAGRARRSAYVIDAWPYSLAKIGSLARLQRLDPCFVAFREGYEALSERYPKGNFRWLPFGVDTDVFRPLETGEVKDVFAFSMGRRHEPLHRELESYCAARGLRYEVSEGGGISDPAELGRMVARSKYFVVTPPDIDHPERAAGFSPLVMRYLEGLAAGTRLLGCLPRSGEFEKMLPRESILEVAPDGSDLARRLDDDDPTIHEPQTRDACSLVREKHSWDERARSVAEVLR